MKVTIIWGNLMRFFSLACLVVGIVTATMEKAFGGFTPIIWFLIAIFCMVTVVCTEMSLTRYLLENKKEK